MDSEHTSVDATGPPSPFTGGNGTESGNGHGHGHSRSGDWEPAGGNRAGAPRSDVGYPDELAGKKGAAAGTGGGGKSKDLAHVPCRFFRVGACTAGAACPFSHSPKEPGQGKATCKWFLKGSCKFGHKCANAHILPGQPPSMDWKNKKAAKAVAAIHADPNQHSPSSGGHGSTYASTSTFSNSAAFPVPASSSGSSVSPSGTPISAERPLPQLAQQYSQAQSQSQGKSQPSGLSSMFGRTAAGGGQSPAAPPGLQRDVDVAAIGMSPMGLPGPSGADLSLPVPAAQQATGQLQAGANASTINRPKPLSYASAAATAAAAATSGQVKATPASGAGASPSTSAFQPQRVYGALPAGSTRSGLAASRAGESPSGDAHSHAAASFQQQQRGQAQSQSQTQSQTHTQALAQAYTPTHPSPLVARSPSQHQHQQQQQAPPLVHQSYSHSAALPSRSSLLNNTRPAVSSANTGAATLASMGLSSPPISGPPGFAATSPSYSMSTSIPRASAFGTSPFGNNAIFLSSSYDEKDDAGSGAGLAARVARSSFSATGTMSGREASPRRAGFASGSLSYGTARNGHDLGTVSDLRCDDDAQDDDDDDDVEFLQGEELVPSSLKHLLTPDERVRKDSRSGGRSGFFNPFDDVDGQEDDDDDNDLGAGDGDEDDAHVQQRYSKSVPAAIHFRQQQKGMASLATYNKAPGSPPTFLSSYASNGGGSAAGMAPLQSPSSASLAKHLLSGTGHAHAHVHSTSGPRVERGFYSSSYAPPLQAGGSGISSLANENRGNSATGPLGTSTSSGVVQAPPRPPLSAANLGTSLPQGLAAGLSRLHLIAAGTERTGYTPPASYAQSPPGHLSFGLGASRPAFASSLTSPAPTSGAPGGGGAATQAGNGSSPSMSHFPASPPSVNGLNPAASAFTGGSSRPSSSFRLPTLSALPPPSHAPPSVARRISGHGAQDGGPSPGPGTGTAPIVGSPLARMDVQHGSYPQQQQQQRQQTRPGPAAGGKIGAQRRTSDAGSREEEEGHGEEDEMVFEMDV